MSALLARVLFSLFDLSRCPFVAAYNTKQNRSWLTIEQWPQRLVVVSEDGIQMRGHVATGVVNSGFPERNTISLQSNCKK